MYFSLKIELKRGRIIKKNLNIFSVGGRERQGRREMNSGRERGGLYASRAKQSWSRISFLAVGSFLRNCTKTSEPMNILNLVKLDHSAYKT
jgi:hypothetical protein